ncbi:MAG TPA: hypothetical protein VGG92_08145 [Caulobacteraceae bacterium]|jgi:hypothetical protein
MLATPPAHAAPAPIVRYAFNQSQLGESLAAWRASAPTGAACSAAGQVTTCTAPLVPLGGGYVARNLTFRFVNGELARINFHTSIDAFSWVMHRIDTRFGEPSRIVRNDIAADSMAFPHVRDVWSNGRATIVVDDPSHDMASLRVTYTLNSLASALPAPS